MKLLCKFQVCSNSDSHDLVDFQLIFSAQLIHSLPSPHFPTQPESTKPLTDQVARQVTDVADNVQNTFQNRAFEDDEDLFGVTSTPKNSLGDNMVMMHRRL